MRTIFYLAINVTHCSYSSIRKGKQEGSLKGGGMIILMSKVRIWSLYPNCLIHGVRCHLC